MKRSVLAGLIAVLLSSAAWGQEKLLLSGKDITNQQLAEKVKALSNLEVLRLSFTQVTDAGLIHLKGLKKLKSIDLSGTQVTDVTLVHLRRLKKLEQLDAGTVKRMMEEVIRQHLGWLVVWGNVFGGLLGLGAAFLNRYYL